MNDTIEMIARCAQHQIPDPGNPYVVSRPNEAADTPIEYWPPTDRGIDGHAEPMTDTIVADVRDYAMSGLVGG